MYSIINVEDIIPLNLQSWVDVEGVSDWSDGSVAVTTGCFFVAGTSLSTLVELSLSSILFLSYRVEELSSFSNFRGPTVKDEIEMN